jgi:hypothetical protein
LQIYVREKWLDEERNQEGHKKGSQKGAGQEEEVKLHPAFAGSVST